MRPLGYGCQVKFSRFGPSGSGRWVTAVGFCLPGSGRRVQAAEFMLLGWLGPTPLNKRPIRRDQDLGGADLHPSRMEFKTI